MRNGPRANGRTFGPQRLLDSRDPVRWTGLGKRLSLRPEECVKHPSKPKRSTITVDRKVRQVMGARLAVSCLGKPPPSALRLHRLRGVRSGRELASVPTPPQIAAAMPVNKMTPITPGRIVCGSRGILPGLRGPGR